MSAARAAVRFVVSVKNMRDPCPGTGPVTPPQPPGILRAIDARSSSGSLRLSVAKRRTESSPTGEGSYVGASSMHALPMFAHTYVSSWGTSEPRLRQPARTRNAAVTAAREAGETIILSPAYRRDDQYRAPSRRWRVEPVQVTDALAVQKNINVLAHVATLVHHAIERAR